MPNIYSLELYAAKCIFEVQCNGLFIFRSDAKNGTSINYPLNTEMIGKDNALKISTYPTILDNGRPSSYSDVTIVGTIKTYGENEITGPESGRLMSRIDFQDIVAQRSVQAFTVTDPTKLFPMEKTFTFDSEGVSFRNRLIDAPVISDEKRLLDYAEKLRDVVARQDLGALWPEYQPKLEDYKLVYPSEFPDVLQWFTDFFKTDFFPGGPIVNFKRDDIGLRSWCGGRVWELYIKPALPFFRNAGLDGDMNTIEAYVGLVGGSLKIIR